MHRTALAIVLLTVLFFAGCGDAPQDDGVGGVVTPDEARSLAKEAYVWGFPIVMNYKTMYSYTIDTGDPEYRGPFNEVACEARLFTPEDKAIVTPNADTPYCMFWMDVRAEPLVLTVPELEPERFYHFQFVDLYTHNFAYVGTLTTGNQAGTFLIAGPDGDVEAPEGTREVIRSETGLVFAIVRTQLFGADDLDDVERIQAGYRLQPLSALAGTEAPPAPSVPDLPAWVEGAQFDARFLEYLDPMMAFLATPAPGDEALWARLARIGVGTDGAFALAALPADVQAALEAGTEDGRAEIDAFIARVAKDPLGSGKIFGTRPFLDASAAQNYQLDRIDVLRSAAAHTGLYGNSASEALYPTYFTDAEGKPLDAASGRYTITFAADALPPVEAFWSLTLYDGKTQLFVDNPLDRYLLNSSMLDGLRREEDGSLVLHIAKTSPGPELEANWLPAPDGPFYLVMRLYGPEKAALEGAWSPPPLVHVGASNAGAPGSDGSR